MNYDCSRFQKGLQELKLDLSEEQIQQFLTFYEYLMEKNKVMNLTGITEFQEVVEKHFLDSLCLVKAFPRPDTGKMLDLGTGAGFPGIPLKIVFPDLDLVLMDSLNKRVRFLEEVIAKLGLQNVTAVHGRAEEMARRMEYRQQFDFCVSRAVSNLASLSEYCLPFVKTGGYFVSYKSADVDAGSRAGQKSDISFGRTHGADSEVPDSLFGSGQIFGVCKKRKGYPESISKKIRYSGEESDSAVTGQAGDLHP